MTEAINMTLVSMKPSLHENDPSLCFYNQAADISVFICCSPTAVSVDTYFYKLQVCGNLEGLSEESIGDYAQAAWLELMPIGDTIIEVTHVTKSHNDKVQSRLCIVRVTPESKQSVH